MIIGPGVNIQSGVNMVTPQDQFFANETLLLSYGPNVAPAGDAQSFTQDASTNNFAVTINGDAKNETFSPFWPDGYWSNYFVASNDRLTLPAAIGNLGSSFCVEFFYYPTVASGQVFVGTAGSGAFQIGWRSTTEFGVASTGVAWLLTSTPTVPTLNAWNHIVFIRTGTGTNQSSLFINGTRVANGTVTDAWNTNLALSIGSAPDNSAGITGWVSNLRIVNGATLPYNPALTTLTQPTAPLTAITGTSLLTCQSNRFVDNSANASSITVSGAPDVTVTEPFGFRFGTVTATVPNSSAVTSGYSSTAFNGTSDYITLPTNQTLLALGNSNFTIEAWVFRTSGTSTATIFSGQNDQATTSGSSYQLYISSSAASEVYIGATGYGVTSPNPTVGQWAHVAMVRNGGTLTTYLNGVQVGTRSDLGTGSINTGATTYSPAIGAFSSGGSPLNGYISNLRVVKGTAVYTGNFTVPTAPLGLTQSAGTNINAITTGQTVFLLNGTTYGNNKNYIDSSANNFPITVTGNPSQTPISPFYGNNYSVFFDGSSNFSAAGSPAWRPGTADFTLECWVYHTTSGTFTVYFIDQTNGITFRKNSSDLLQISQDAVADLLSSSTTIPINQWAHVAVSRAGTTLRLFINGTQVGSLTNSTNFAGTGTLTIGATAVPNARMSGFISNMRMVNGTALYTANFTPPTAPLTAVSGTGLLFLQGTRFTDNSNYGTTFTVTGTPVISQYIPFAAPTYSAALYGGSALFNGSSNCLSASGSISLSGQFTAQCWFYNTSSSGAQQTLFVFNSVSGNGYGSLRADCDQGNVQFNFTVNLSTNGSSWASTISTNSIYVKNQWNHFAVTRDSNNLVRVFLNGVLINSATVSGALYSASTTHAIGCNNLPGSITNPFNGYISNLQLVNGTALYTSSFTPPTAPLTAVTNTSLLLNTNNVNTYDLTLSNPVTNVSGASQSTRQPFTVPTTQITYSGISTFGSAYFDGTGDYLNNIGTASSFNFLHNSSALFTVEAWVYTTAGGVQRTLIDTNGAGSAGIGTLVLIDTDNTLRVFITKGSSGNPVCDSRSNSTVPLNQWVHLAVTYDQSLGSTNAKFYINGVASGTGNKTANAPTNSNASYSMAIGSYNGPGSYFTGFISNLRVNNSIVYTSAFTPPSFPLSTIPQTSLLTVQQDGPANNNSFIDTGPNNLLVTRSGNTTQGSFTPYWPNGYWSNYFNGSSGLQLPSSSAFSIATSTTPFTIEAWIYPTASGGAIFSEQWPQTGAVNIAFTLSDGTNVYGSGLFPALGYYNGTSWVTAAESNTAVVLNTWSHLAVVFTGSTTRIYINGIDRTASSPTPATTWGVTGNNGEGWYIGRNWDTVSTIYFTGYISNLRFTNGTAVYTTAFTPSITPLTVTANTTLLACQSNRYRDNSINNLSFTVSNGTPSVQRFQPFSPPAAYTPALYGASAYFDGTGDYLVSANSGTLGLGTGDYTIEFWTYPTATSRQDWIDYNNGSQRILIYYSGSAIIAFTNPPNAAIITGPALVTNQWYHIAVSRQSNNTRLFVNGVQQGSTYTTSQNYGVTGTVNIGRDAGGSTVITGYVSDVRVLKGTGLYTANFTPPTQPLQCIANTVFLLPGNNAAIYDRTGTNDLETLGNAQTVTSVRRLGAGCMYFDGNGDYLTAPTSDAFRFPGDFTIEFWANPSSFAIIGVLFDTRSSGTSTTGISASFGTDGRLNYFADNATRITSSAAYSTGTWLYVTIVRSSGVTTMYVNGSSVGTYSAATNYSDGTFTIGTTIDNRAATTTLKYNGYLDNFQITKSARYTANFTTPVDNPIYR